MVKWWCNGYIDNGGDVGVIDIDDGGDVEDGGDLVTTRGSKPDMFYLSHVFFLFFSCFVFVLRVKNGGEYEENDD
ncbi:hypothetical protein F2Q69_00013599 [Brassica cretica]|uniref:Transmembrane protein n=1 Tax=Brassica cretica TaxID=69181 RepID=A0A8S9R1J7_BRACR|nr:hypothetical protein F2Q69_00013599 [Brassica cretica]